MVAGPPLRERIDAIVADGRRRHMSADYVLGEVVAELADAIDQLRIGLAVLEHAITNDTGPRIGG